MRSFKLYLFTTLFLVVAGAIAQVGVPVQVDPDSIKFPSKFGDLSNVPRRIDSSGNFQVINISPDFRSGKVHWRNVDDFGIHESAASFFVASAYAGCPCCPTPDTMSITATSTDTSADTTTSTDTSADTTTSTATSASICCVPCYAANVTNGNYQSTKSDPMQLGSNPSVLVQTTLMIPSEGFVVVRALCYVDRELRNSETSAIEFGIISEGGIPFQSWEMKKLEPVHNPADSRMLISMERQFPVSEENTNVRLSARNHSEHSSVVAQLRMLFVTFVPNSNESASE
jgi:hypothetical protein